MDKLKQLLAQLTKLLGIAKDNLPTPQGEKIYQTALMFIGLDASPNDEAPDELGCANSVSCVIKKAGFPITIFLSTMALYQALLKSPDWLQVERPLKGDVLISPTGLGGKNGITNGHTGIVGVNGTIMSNSSATGTFLQNYTLDTWKARYSVKGNYPMFFFRRIS